MLVGQGVQGEGGDSFFGVHEGVGGDDDFDVGPRGQQLGDLLAFAVMGVDVDDEVSCEKGLDGLDGDVGEVRGGGVQDLFEGVLEVEVDERPDSVGFGVVRVGDPFDGGVRHQGSPGFQSSEVIRALAISTRWSKSSWGMASMVALAWSSTAWSR